MCLTFVEKNMCLKQTIAAAAAGGPEQLVGTELVAQSMLDTFTQTDA
jgi:hypothetical protein